MDFIRSKFVSNFINEIRIYKKVHYRFTNNNIYSIICLVSSFMSKKGGVMKDNKPNETKKDSYHRPKAMEDHCNSVFYFLSFAFVTLVKSSLDPHSTYDVIFA